MKRFTREEDGAVLAFVALASPLFVLMLAFVVDMNLGRLTANKLQITVDSAALAGASQLDFKALENPSEFASVKASVDAMAIAYAAKNYGTDNANVNQSGTAISVLKSSNIFMGFWDVDTRRFWALRDSGSFVDLWYETGFGDTDDGEWLLPGDSNYALPEDPILNAVWAKTERSSANSNPLISVFASFVGLESYDIEKVAVAVLGGNPNSGDCLGGGVFSNDYNETGSNNEYNAFCLQGQPWVDVSSNNFINPGSLFIMPDASNYKEGSDNVYDDGDDEDGGNDKDDMVVSGFYDLQLPGAVPGYIDDMIGNANDVASGAEGFLPDSAEYTRSGGTWTPEDSKFAYPVVKVDGDLNSSWLEDADNREYFRTFPPTILYVTGAVTLDGGNILGEDGSPAGTYEFRDVLIVTEKDITVKGDTTSINNSVLVARDGIKFDSNGNIGDEASCEVEGRFLFDMHAYSTQKVEFSSTSDIFATIVGVSGNDPAIFEVGSGNGPADKRQIDGLYVEANGKSNIGSNNEFGGCAQGIDTGLGLFPLPFVGDLTLSLRL